MAATEKNVGATTVVSSFSELPSVGKDIMTVQLNDKDKVRRFSRYKNSDGSIGGFVESTAKVDASYVGPTAIVAENAVVKYSRVEDTAMVFGNASVSEAEVCGRSVIFGSAQIFSMAKGENSESRMLLIENSTVFGSPIISGNSSIRSSFVFGGAEIRDSEITNSQVEGKTKVQNSSVKGSKIYGDAQVQNSSVEDSKIYENAQVFDSKVSGAEVCGAADISNTVINPGEKVGGTERRENGEIYPSATPEKPKPD